MNTACHDYRLRTFFICLLAGLGLIAVALLLSGRILAGVALAFMSHMLVLYAQLKPSAQLLGPVITGFQTDEQEIWLTIDDGPDAEETPVVLDLLDEHQAKATFFVIGRQVQASPEIVRLILERGHQIGNHTMTHPERQFWHLSERHIIREINDCSTVISEKTGRLPRLFRAPVGHKPWFLHPVLKKLNLPLIGWTARGFDGISKDSDRVVERIRKHIAPGAIILLHEGRETLSDTLSKLLPDLSDENYRCVLPSPDSFLAGRRKTIR